MRALMMAVAMTATVAAPLVAAERGGHDTPAYVTGLGGFSTSIGHSTGDVRLEGGIRIAPHTMIFGDVGRFRNLQADLQPTLDTTAAALADSQGLMVTGGGRLPATYGLGGLRVEVPTHSRVLPYTLGGVGVAHLAPTPQFTFASGVMPDGSTPTAGTDVTAALVSAGSVTSPATSNALMLSLGGGVQVTMAQHWVVDSGYRYSRIAADTTLSAPRLNANGLTFGIGYRF